MSVHCNLKGYGTFGPTSITYGDHTHGMITSDQYQDDINLPIRLRDDPLVAAGAVQHRPGLPRPPRQRTQIHPNLPEWLHQYNDHRGTTRQMLLIAAAQHVALQNETRHVYACVP